MKITITIETGNAAFEDGPVGVEVARILREYADMAEDGHLGPVALADINGNTVGAVKVTGRRAS